MYLKESVVTMRMCTIQHVIPIVLIGHDSVVKHFPYVAIFVVITIYSWLVSNKRGLFNSKQLVNVFSCQVVIQLEVL